MLTKYLLVNYMKIFDVCEVSPLTYFDNIDNNCAPG